MQVAVEDDLLSLTQSLLLDDVRVTVLVSQVQFEPYLNPSQDETLATLGEVDEQLRLFLRRIVRPRTHISPAAAYLASLLRVYGYIINLVERQLRLYGSSYGARGYVAGRWPQALVALQQYMGLLREVLRLFNSNSLLPPFEEQPLATDINNQNTIIQQLLQDQVEFEASHWREVYQSHEESEVRSENPPSTYVTPPSSIRDGDDPDDPPIPLPQFQPRQTTLDLTANAAQQAGDRERSRIYAILKSIWICDSQSPQERSKFLAHAILSNSVNGVSLLLDLGIGVDQPCNKDLPLCLAAKLGHDEIVQMLIERGATVEKRSGSGSTALMSAAGAGQTSTIALLLDNKADINAQSTYKGINGFTPLMRAVRSGHQNACRLLIDRGAGTGDHNDAGESLLHVAIQSGRSEIIDLVLESHVQIGVTDQNGNTVLHLAASKGLVGLSTILLQRMNTLVKIGNHKQETPLHHAIRTRSPELVKLFLDQGAFPNAPDHKGRTALHRAIEKDCSTLVPLLLEREADPDFRDKNGKTPLHYAVELANMEIIQALLHKAPAMNIEDTNKETPLQYAVKSGNLPILQLLVAHGADPKWRVSDGKSLADFIMELSPSEELSRGMLRDLLRQHKPGQPSAVTFGFPVLPKATREGKVALVRLLCDHCPEFVNENPPSESGFCPPLHEALNLSHHRSRRELVNFFCGLPQTDLNILDHQGNLPLHQAVDTWHDGLLTKLIARGADKNKPHATTGLPPLHYAVHKQNLRAVEELIANKADAEQRVNGEQCDWCRKHLRPAGRNARCVLQAIPEKDRSSDWEAINVQLTQVLNPRPSPSPGSSSSGGGKQRRK
ncbi:hypothetical protein ASPACDRAFT_1824, partial [Aspergillus aculeatus ATCC 16872]